MFALPNVLAVLIASSIANAAATPPPAFQPAAHNAGNGTKLTSSSAHFQVFDVTPDQAAVALKLLESAYTCLVDTLGWRSSGLSYRRETSEDGPWYKMNAYGVSSPQAIGGAAGVMGSDFKTGAAFIKVVAATIKDPLVTVHEYGHALTYYERNWVDMGRTGTWWEPLAEFVADTYNTSPWCDAARKSVSQPTGRTKMDLNKVVGSAHQVLVDGTPGGNANYYQSWPFLSYLSYNPDNYPGLGKTVTRDMIRKYKLRSNETPLHALTIVAKSVSVQQIVGKYWARMAWGDIGHPQSRQRFDEVRARLNFANLDSTGSGTYKVKAARAPKYMGASIIPLKGTGKISVKVTASDPFTATLAIRPTSGAIRYVELAEGAGGANVADGEQAALAIANTPKELIMYNGFEMEKTPQVNKGLLYTLQLTGATA
ncbi:hypothetical protein EJ08DRAFT_582 [Tothia fuscella]|uniref:Dockerin type 1 n=1 Tax=Tothia fuscella TaxID=1048955 RepID=A0A9P4U581_9PEZI|nr:hypothetical protein EJ08DRAFT_582 [Tothia fuscella]